MLAGHRCTLESDISKFLFGKCPTPTLKADYTYTLSCISQSRCQKTLLGYNAHWFRFRSWCQQNNKLSFLPADPMHVAMFLSNSLRFALSRGFTYSTIIAASAAIFTTHNMAGLNDVTSHSFVQAVRSCERSLSSGGQFRKFPLSLDFCIITASFLL